MIPPAGGIKKLLNAGSCSPAWFLAPAMLFCRLPTHRHEIADFVFHDLARHVPYDALDLDNVGFRQIDWPERLRQAVDEAFVADEL